MFGLLEWMKIGVSAVAGALIADLGLSASSVVICWRMIASISEAGIRQPSA